MDHATWVATSNGLMLCLVLAALYLAPTLVAYGREWPHPQRFAIFVLNVLGGWSVLGWIAALVWACTTTREQREAQAFDRAQHHGI